MERQHPVYVVICMVTMVVAVSYFYYHRCLLCGPSLGGNLPQVKLLLSRDADPNAIDRYGATPLMHASWQSHPEIVLILLDAGADPNAVAKDGETALMHAVEGDAYEVVRILLRVGANPNVVAEEGYTALDIAKARRNSSIISLLEAAGAV